ncbi:MAG: signal peptidase II [Bacteriovoracaceae bacterium]
MKKQNKLTLLLFVGVLVLDQISKMIFWKGSIHNSGIIFGSLSNLDPVIRIIFFSTLFTLILFIGFLLKFYFLNSPRFKLLNNGLALFLAGITGNAIDRVRLGAVIDFIPVRLPMISLYYANFSDVVQLIAFVIVIYCIFKQSDELFPEDSQRRFNLMEPKYQISFAFKFSLVSFFSMLVMGTFSYVFMKVYNPLFNSYLQSVFVFFWMILGLLMTLTSFLFGLAMSARKIGPIFALKRFISEVKEGKVVELKLRELDSFKELEEISKEINELIKKD